MNEIKFETGLKRYSINGDESKVIEFDPSDVTILQRIKEAQDKIAEIEKIKVEGNGLAETAQVMEQVDKKIRELIDYIFDSPVSDIAFGNKNPISTVKGKPLYERFLTAVLPVMQEAVAKEQEKAKKNSAKYLEAVKDFK